jgi:hypothetical protein
MPVRDRSVGLRDDQWKALVAIAEREDLSVAHLVRRAVAAYIDRHRVVTLPAGDGHFPGCDGGAGGTCIVKGEQ